MKFLSEKAKKLTPYTAGLQPQECGWVKLNTNENPYPPSSRVTDAMQYVDLANLRLYPDGDSSYLREVIASVHNVEKNNIFCGNSSDEVLSLAFQAFYGGKENVASPDISYGFYPVWAEAHNVKMSFVPLHEDFSISVEDYINTNGVVIANPNAPTSLALELSQIEALLKQNPKGIVLIDEAYINFASVKSADSLINKYENLLVVRTFSKSYSLAGLRVGYAIANENIINGLRLVRDSFNSYPLGMLSQTAAAAAIADNSYLKETTSRIIHTRERTVSELQKLGYSVLPPQGNFIFMKADNAPDLYNYLYENKILVRLWTKERIKNYLRVSIGTENDMEVFINAVKMYGGIE